MEKYYLREKPARSPLRYYGRHSRTLLLVQYLNARNSERADASSLEGGLCKGGRNPQLLITEADHSAYLVHVGHVHGRRVRVTPEHPGPQQPLVGVPQAGGDLPLPCLMHTHTHTHNAKRRNVSARRPRELKKSLKPYPSDRNRRGSD